jgi:lipopolysaccharide transport system permease protein
MKGESNKFDQVIMAKRSFLDINLKELWNYRDLIYLFVKRDVISFYKQTILGPIWFFLQPLFSSITYMIVFSFIARVDTEGVPPILFYLCGTIFWAYFADTFKKTSTTFLDNSHIFGKVYFPRLAVPIALVITNLVRFAIQMILFLIVLVYFQYTGSIDIQWNALIVVPLCTLLLILYSFGAGIIVSSLTTKYRDLRFLFEFGIQLFMYVTPILYPLSFAQKQSESAASLLLYNPLTNIFEALRYSLFGKGSIDYEQMIFLNGGIGIILLFVGIIIFNKTEKNFMDII